MINKSFLQVLASFWEIFFRWLFVRLTHWLTHLHKLNAG